ncbi:hypothetical protein [Limnoraphis robusta]|uniref:Uncharacterized protein n=1 Tax=Limnoraphis robusta CS-951 TaxID=1637645 RepID=A0A0F5YDP8_9CYAN|nr:hypothetical protein [Limnoraphis robusta]KKD36752.1 hypothetical protein WN50_18130 [Limnoraphis robusta CS-951]
MDSIFYNRVLQKIFFSQKSYYDIIIPGAGGKSQEGLLKKNREISGKNEFEGSHEPAVNRESGITGA